MTDPAVTRSDEPRETLDPTHYQRVDIAAKSCLPPSEPTAPKDAT